VNEKSGITEKWRMAYLSESEWIGDCFSLPVDMPERARFVAQEIPGFDNFDAISPSKPCLTPPLLFTIGQAILPNSFACWNNYKFVI